MTYSVIKKIYMTYSVNNTILLPLFGFSRRRRRLHLTSRSLPRIPYILQLLILHLLYLLHLYRLLDLLVVFKVLCEVYFVEINHA